MKQLFTFYLLIISAITFAQDQIYVHTANPSNISGHITYIDAPALNGHPDAKIIVTHAWNPNGLSGVYNDNVTGVWYNGSQWAIYNEDTSVAMVDGSHYFVYIADGGQIITHIASAANIGIDPSYTVIDEPSLNGNPNPKLAVSTYYNPNGVYNDNNYGLFFEAGASKWNIYSESGVAIPLDAAFNVLVQGAGATTYRHQALATNISNNYTIIDHPSLNGNPDATFVISHYWGILGGSQIILDKVLGVWYTGTNWSVYTEDQSPMPDGIVFDLNILSQTLETPSNTISEVKIYPNPTSDKVTFSAKQNINSIIIYNLLGQQVKNISVTESNNIVIDLSDLAIGTYLAKIQAANSSETIKLIKE